MAEQLVSLGCDNASEIAFEESILDYLRELWTEEEYDFLESLEAQFYNPNQSMLDDIDEMMPSEDEEWLLAGARKSEQQGGNPLFSVLRERVHRPRRWQGGAVRQEHFRLQLQQNRPPTDEKLGEAIAEAFYNNVRDYVARERLNPAHFKMQMKIHHNGDGVHVWTSSPVLPLEDWVQNRERTRQYLQQLSNELNSSQNIDVTKDDFFAELTLIYQPPAGGKNKKYNIKSLSYQQMLKKKHCLISIRNTDELCCARAIVTLLAREQKDPQYRTIYQGGRLQTTRAYRLHRDANVPEGPCGMAELEAFQTFLAPDYQLVVLEGMKGHLLFKNSLFDDAPHVIALLKTNEHYHAITSIPAFLNRSYFCRFCEKGYNAETAEHHNCQGQNCPACRRTKKSCRNFATFVTPTHLCPQCNRVFYGPNCLEAHRQGKKSICSRFAKCPECCKVYERKHRHACYITRCKNCQQGKHVNHRCFIQPIASNEVAEEVEEEVDVEEEEEETEAGAEKKVKPPPLIVAFDIECEAVPLEESEDKVFSPVLIGYSTLGEVDDYHEVTTIAEFLDHLFAKTNVEGEDRDVYCYAHNLRAFDGLFIQEELYSKGYTIDGILNQGAKYLSFECKNLIFRDSMNFFSMPLERLSSTFNLRELHKGFFPYSWISKDSEGYIGEFPPATDYHPERMSEKRRKEFLTWYPQQAGKEFNYDRELSLYLKSDVLVLKEALSAFANEMFDLTGVKPLTECVTIASTAFRVWQKNFLEPDLIALEPQAGWRSNNINQSKEALEWLSFENAQIGGGIRHVRSSEEGEMKVTLPNQKQVFVDGFHEPTNTVFEFLGCNFHGCVKCHPHRRHIKRYCHPDRTIEEVYEATLKKIEQLQAAGFNVKVKWECDYIQERKENPQLKQFVDTFELVSPLEPRDAFFGGRTEAITLYAKAQEDETITYIDYTSLYPSINKYGLYPTGFPHILFNPEDQDIHHYFGIAKVDILPPERLYHPVLPMKQHGKLTFPLCGACVTEEMAKPMHERSNLCGHTPEQRVLRGTWVTLELQKAVEKGYRIIKIHEVFHFPPSQRRQGLFADYVNTFLKVKQEAAGWPEGCETEAEKTAYLREYEEKEGIRLEHVAENPGRKAIAKLLLNSLWGKFGERQNKPQTHSICNPAQLFRLLDDHTYHLTNVRICSDDVLEVVTTMDEDAFQSSFKINVFIAAFTTAQARLKLYSALDSLKDRVLYMDTDSIIYKSREGQDMLPTGRFLGQFTNETPGDSIAEFVSGGPKNYGYLTKNGKTECKVRGFSLNYETKQRLNYETMKHNLLTELEEPLDEARTIAIPIHDYFERDQINKQIKLTERVKKYKLVFDKRIVDPATKTSTPYGYVWMRGGV